ncbi:MAG: hypothetical protein GF398_16615 [Chitinivibrionales bacterium]|nr:hypothetical protein [Chitinivibrionales bacterium]
MTKSIADSHVVDSKVGIALFLKDAGCFTNINISNCAIEAKDDFPVLIDHTPRSYKNAQLGHIRNVTLQNLNIVSSGRLLVEGLACKPIEEIKIRNIDWQVESEAPIATARKPWGTMVMEPDPDKPDIASNPYHLLCSNVNRLTLENIRIGIKKGINGNRNPTWVSNVSDPSISNITSYEFDGADLVRVPELGAARSEPKLASA